MIAILGVPGIGKTTACKSFVQRNPTFGYVSASGVLRAASGLSAERLASLSRLEILNNQTLLARTLPEAIARTEAAFVLLDGQNVIDNGEELVELPVGVLESLKPRGLVLLEASPNEVWARRENDTRKRPERSIEEIVGQMSIVRSVTEQYARTLSIPLVTALAVAHFELDDSLRRLLSISV